MNGTIIEAMAIEAQTHTQTRVEVWKPEGLTDKPFQPEFLMETNSKHGGGGGIFEWQWSGSARSEWSILRARARHLSGLGAPLAAPVVACGGAGRTGVAACTRGCNVLALPLENTPRNIKVVMS